MMVKEKRHVPTMKVLYYDCLIAAQKKKEIRKDTDCNALADYMCNFTYGYVNLGMKRMNKRQLRKSVALALEVIKS